MLETLRQIHITCALATGMLFTIRGIWMITGSPKLKTPVMRVAPHIIDTVLLATALAMLAASGLNPLQHPWLLAKIIALVFYIGFGLAAFRFGRTRGEKIAAWLVALALLLSIYGFAFSKRVIFW